MNKFLTLFLILTFNLIQPIFGQKNIQKLNLQVAPPICYASGKVEKSFTPPPDSTRLKSNFTTNANILVYYNSSFPAEAKLAFEYAISIWEGIIQSDIPIHIQANWELLDKTVLGSAGPTNYYTNFENIPHKNRYYPVAIAERITKSEINGSSAFDIISEFNSNIDWYFGIDGQTPITSYDFVTVVLHEIAHGLGFTGFFYISNNLGLYDWDGIEETAEASAFDLLVVNKINEQLVDNNIYTPPSAPLKTALTSGILYANSPVAISNGTGAKPRLYAPATFYGGSSIYHLNDATHQNELMTHEIGKAEAVHDPGVLVSGIMADIGWKHMFINLDKPKDIEQAKPIKFNVSIESDYKLEPGSAYIIYSNDKFINHIDSLNLLKTEVLNLYSAELTPAFENGEIHYYIKASDIKNRVFTLPTEAPEKIYVLTIGLDRTKPVIKHEPISYFLLGKENLKISALVDDNVGIDSVFVKYYINGVAQIPFQLILDTLTEYTGSFGFNLEQLNDGDLISYNIIARDSSKAQNTEKIPFNKKFYFSVEKILNSVEGYQNDFNNPSSDFVIFDFDIYNAINFDDAALHSPHPYPSPEMNDISWNFSTLLKHPIILSGNSKIMFDEVVLVEPGEPQAIFGDDYFWDYVIIEGSKDSGKSWLALEDGYDSGANSNWENKYNQNITGQDSQTEGTRDLFVSHEIDPLGNRNFVVGDTILLRFRLFSDPYAHGWGWAIDNLRIQSPVSTPLTVLSPGNILVYPNPFNSSINVSIQANKIIKELAIEVFNLFGQKIYISENKNVTGEILQTVNLANFAAGMYLVSVKENGETVYSRKIIKE